MFPTEPGSATSTPLLESSLPSAKAARRILIVDDVIVNLKILWKIINSILVKIAEHLGIQPLEIDIDWAESGEEAVIKMANAAKNNVSYLALISDIQMAVQQKNQKLSGYTVATVSSDLQIPTALILQIPLTYLLIPLI